MSPPLAAPAATPLHPLHPLHPVLAARHTSRAFDPSAEVTSQELATLLEAARWATSRDNTQPWRFVVGRREDETHQRIVAALQPGDRRWAHRAPLLLVGAHLSRSGTGAALPHAAYDLGQAVAHLAVQATSVGLSSYQLYEIDGAALHAGLGLPEDTRAAVVVAVGRPGDPASLPEDLRAREAAPRERHPAATLLLG